MEYTKMELEGFIVAGIAVRTTNQNDKCLKDLDELWDKFTRENIAASIPDKISDDIYCVYTDYETDFMGEYTTILGYKVSTIENLPEGLAYKEIPGMDCQRFVAEGKLPDCIGETWRKIWSQPDTERAYLADFDVHGAEAKDPDNARVYIYLSI